MSVAYRNATVADAATLAAIGVRTFVATFGRLYSPANLAVFLRNHTPEQWAAALSGDAQVRLAEDDGEAIGYARIGPLTFDVDDERRRSAGAAALPTVRRPAVPRGGRRRGAARLGGGGGAAARRGRPVAVGVRRQSARAALLCPRRVRRGKALYLLGRRPCRRRHPLPAGARLDAPRRHHRGARRHPPRLLRPHGRGVGGHLREPQYRPRLVRRPCRGRREPAARGARGRPRRGARHRPPGPQPDRRRRRSGDGRRSRRRACPRRRARHRPARPRPRRARRRLRAGAVRRRRGGRRRRGARRVEGGAVRRPAGDRGGDGGPRCPA